MIARHNDIVKIIAQMLKKNKNEMLNLKENEKDEFGGKYLAGTVEYNYHSQIQLTNRKVILIKNKWKKTLK
jgi:hypothetical protein